QPSAALPATRSPPPRGRGHDEARATVCRFGRLGAWGRLLAVDFVSASVKANGPMASRLVRGFDASNPRTLHAGKRLSGGLPVDLAGGAAPTLRPVPRNAPKAIAARSRRPGGGAMTAYQASPIRRTRATKVEVEARREALLDIIEAGRPMTGAQGFYQAAGPRL